MVCAIMRAGKQTRGIKMTMQFKYTFKALLSIYELTHLDAILIPVKR